MYYDEWWCSHPGKHARASHHFENKTKHINQSFWLWKESLVTLFCSAFCQDGLFEETIEAVIFVHIHTYNIYIMPWKIENIVNVNRPSKTPRNLDAMIATLWQCSQKKKEKIGLLQEDWFLDWSYVLGMYRHLSFVPQINSIILIYNGTLRDLSGSAYLYICGTFDLACVQ